MGFGGGVCLRLTQTVLRAIELLASIVILGIFSYFLAILADHHLPISSHWKAVEGISGAGVLYGIFGVLLTLFLGGISIFAFAAVVLDIAFAGAFAYVAYATRKGADSCSAAVVNTPLGTGPTNSKADGYGQDGFGFGSGENVTYFPKLGRACRLNKAVFACSIILIGLFLITAVVQVLLARHHKKEKRYGPGPSNSYTSGTGRRGFFRRKNNKHNTRDAELATAGRHEKHSYDTGYTGTTVDGPNHGGYTSTNGYAHPTTTSTNY